MKMHKVSLLAALAAGALLAFAPILRAEDTKPEGRPPGQGPRAGMAKERLDKMATELNLTAEQKTKVEAVLKEQAETMRGMKDATPEERRAKMQEVRKTMEPKMKEILTSEQYEKWLKLREQRPGRSSEGGGVRPKKDGATN